MKIAVVGKGGVGKTSISGTLARLLARRGRRVLAIDGDPNPNLALALGVPPEQMSGMRGLSPELVEDGESGLRLTRTLEQVLSEYALEAPDGVTLLAMRPEEKAGAG
jgi:CO dehydrogenase maturation factor